MNYNFRVTEGLALKQFKIVVAGPRASGKTEMISKLAELFGRREAIKTDSEGATVCMDYTYCDVDDTRFHIYGTPGADHLSVVRQSLSKGMNVLILVVDNSKPESFSKAHEIYEEICEGKEVPMIVAVNKRNSEEFSVASEISNLLKVPNEQIITIDAKSGEGIDNLFSVTRKAVWESQSVLKDA
ncbi:GTP-binding protein [Candidatus Jordarchaeum sp.]|uniref:GTP-binding protein n=1 Tax=Candidatus Jordarchaeum sp. TaxID=2823881 RepID=UPI00404B95BA